MEVLIWLILIIIFLVSFHILFNNKKIIKEDFLGKYTAVIVEPREHKALEFVLKNFLENLNDNWNILIMHGNKNKGFIDKILDKLEKFKDRISLINLNVDNLSIKDYNNLLVSKKFHDYIPTEVFLVFQTDTIICGDYKNYINDFLQYDYAGAPWLDKEVGNGGLSIRRKSKMLEIIDKCPYSNQNEDLYFALACPEIYRYKPDHKTARNFSVEQVYHEDSFGIHKPWLNISRDDVDKKNKFCPGLKELVELNN